MTTADSFSSLSSLLKDASADTDVRGADPGGGGRELDRKGAALAASSVAALDRRACRSNHRSVAVIESSDAIRSVNGDGDAGS
jgi:hypothetical protein